VRQEYNEAALSDPLGLSAADELVEDALRVVGEVAELCLPADQRTRAVLRVAQFEPCRHAPTYITHSLFSPAQLAADLQRKTEASADSDSAKDLLIRPTTLVSI